MDKINHLSRQNSSFTNAESLLVETHEQTCEETTLEEETYQGTEHPIQQPSDPTEQFFQNISNSSSEQNQPNISIHEEVFEANHQFENTQEPEHITDQPSNPEEYFSQNSSYSSSAENQPNPSIPQAQKKKRKPNRKWIPKHLFRKQKRKSLKEN